jgi:hypothetical protein
MKTCWKSLKTDKEALAKQREQEARYGVPFTRYDTGDGMKIRPCINGTVGQSADYIEVIKAAMVKMNLQRFESASFDRLAEVTGLSLIQVLENCNFMIHTRIVSMEIGRSGPVIAIYPNHV